MTFRQKPICTDDFGDEVHRCRYTKVYLWPHQAVSIGAMIPGVRSQHFISQSLEAKQSHKEAGILFHESEANCNTCVGLVRSKREKRRDGFMEGKCNSHFGVPSASPYADRQAASFVVFHPDDPMHMPCYQSRWAK